MKKRVLLFFVLMLCFVCIFGCNDRKSSQVVMTVNGEKITEQQYQTHLQMIKKGYEAQNGKLDNEKDAEMLNTIEDQNFEDLIMQVIVKQEARKQGIEVKKTEIDKALRDMKDSMGEQHYKEFIENLDFTNQDIRDQLALEQLYIKLQDKITADVKVKEEDIKKYYEENQEIFKEEAGLQISHILVDSKQDANNIIEKLEQGEDFSTLARQYSRCPSKDVGGDLGVFNEKSNYVPEFEQAVARLQPGEMTTEPVKTKFGYHVIKAGEMKAARTISLEEAREDIKNRLLENEKNKVFTSYLQNLRSQAKIEDKR